MSVWASIDPALVQALGWTLLHFLWQGLLAAALLAGIELATARSAARLRYLACAATLLLMLLLPAATFRLLPGGAAAAEPGPAPTAAALPASEAAAFAPAERAVAAGLRERLAPALPVLVAFWSLGVALLSLRTLGGWLLAQQVKRSGTTQGLETLE